MITVGIDCGTRNIKAIVLQDGRIAGTSIVPAGFDTRADARRAFDEALLRAGMKRADVTRIIATGAGRKAVDFASDDIAIESADAKGIVCLLPGVRTVIDVGAEEGRALRVTADGIYTDCAVNERCAAGAGTFMETMARALEIGFDEMSDLYFQSTKEITMSAQCVVFAESEMVSLIHSRTPKPDIVRAIINAIADRVVSIMKMVGFENDVAAIGGVSLNKGFKDAVERRIKMAIIVPPEPLFVSALGAAYSGVE